MFTMLHAPVHTYKQPHHYTPVVSSPLSSPPLRRSLSPRDPNVATSPRASIFSSKPIMSPTPSKQPRASPNTSASASASSSSSRESAYSKRVTKVNPLIHGRGGSTSADGKETRRKLFLKKVRDDAEEKRWKARGGDDEMTRAILISEQKRREDMQRMEAMGLDATIEEEDILSLDEILADDVALMEEAELQALAALDIEQAGHQEMPPDDEMDSLLFSMDEQNPTPDQKSPHTDTVYGSDDDEYDHIFMDVIQEETRMATQSSQSVGGDQDMMDMS